MSDWTIQINDGEANTFAAEGLSQLFIRRMAAGISTATFAAVAQTALTDAYKYAHGATAIIRYGATRRFYGRIVTLPRQGDAQSESVQYTVADPWWYLERITYMQTWKIYDETGEELVNAVKSRVVLYQDADGERMTAGAQVADVIDWAIAKGAPIQKGAIEAGVALPYDERDNLSCTDAINTVLRWHPDWVAWFDHSTEPYPTFHCRARANLTAATVALTACANIAITPRHDLQVPGIHITYEKRNTDGDVTYNTVSVDAAGDVNAFDAVYALFALEGQTRTWLTQKIVTEDFPEDLTDTSWWQARIQEFFAVAAPDLHIDSAERDQTELPRILVEGAVQDWMEEDEIVSAACTVQGVAEYYIRDALGDVVKHEDHYPIRYDCVVTNAETKTYRRMDSFQSGESVPTGVAAALYESWSALHYEGSIAIVTEECAGVPAIGHRLRISGGRAEWVSMDAVIQDITEDVDRGATTLNFGPPGRLEADSLVALFRALRSRRYSWSRDSRATGEATAGGTDLSGKTPNTSAQGGAGEIKELCIRDGDSGAKMAIELSPEAIDSASAQVIKPRKIRIVEPSGQADPPYNLVTRHLLVSEPDGESSPFDPDEPPPYDPDEPPPGGACDQNDHPQDEDPAGGEGAGDGTEHPGDDDDVGNNDPGHPGGGGDGGGEGGDDGTGHPSDNDCYSTIPTAIP